jgi:enoyl-CoA hydratase/carnithine racemase
VRAVSLGPLTGAEELDRHLAQASGPLLLDLPEHPAWAVDPAATASILGSLASFDGVLIYRFEGTLRTPLVEIALLSHECLFPSDAKLDLRGARLTPLVARLGPRAAFRLLALEGPLLPASHVLRAAGLDGSRSPLAVRSALELLSPPFRSRRAAFAAELARFRLTLSAPDRLEGVRAFREKRPARFDW